ncbi:C2 domain containing protein [Trichuris trichiura]|uniref:C2 domain containing protein n=1 Tax=Trichuris trichiura TaxID=36087 RepID=A0A077Z356_TRITR|nr:C2 domain containing protein [Trichuris trichiura]
MHKEQDPINILLFTMQQTHLDHDKPVYMSRKSSTVSWSQETELAKPKNVDTTAEILLTISFMKKQQTLKVVLNSAKNLLPKKSDTSVDPFATLWLVHGKVLLDRCVTRSKYKTKNPIFNETFNFSIEVDEPENLQLVIAVGGSSLPLL